MRPGPLSERPPFPVTVLAFLIGRIRILQEPLGLAEMPERVMHRHGHSLILTLASEVGGGQSWLNQVPHPGHCHGAGWPWEQV